MSGQHLFFITLLILSVWSARVVLRAAYRAIDLDEEEYLKETSSDFKFDIPHFPSSQQKGEPVSDWPWELTDSESPQD